MQGQEKLESEWQRRKTPEDLNLKEILKYNKFYDRKSGMDLRNEQRGFCDVQNNNIEIFEKL